MKKEIVIAVVGLAAVVGTEVATNKFMNRPATVQAAPPSTKPLPDDGYRGKLVKAYITSQSLSEKMGKKELALCEADKECSSIHVDLQAAVSDTNHLADEIQKTLNLKPGTSFTVNTDRGSVDYFEPK